MGVVITIDDIRAYTEVDYIIHHMNQKYIDKVPQKMKEFFSSYKDPNFPVNINPYVPLQNQGLKRYTLEIIALLHLKYWCEDEERKKELYSIMLRNQEKLEEQMKEKFGVDKLFSNETENEQEDFTKPKMVQRYNQFTNQNTDIQDYTDHVEEKTEQNVNNKETLPSKTETKKVSIFEKIKIQILGLFKKKEKEVKTKG